MIFPAQSFAFTTVKNTFKTHRKVLTPSLLNRPKLEMFHYKLIATLFPQSESTGHKCVGNCTSPMTDPQATNESFSLPQHHHLPPKLNTSNKQTPAPGHKVELKPKIKAQTLLRWWLLVNTPGKLFPPPQLLPQPRAQFQQCPAQAAAAIHSQPSFWLFLPHLMGNGMCPHVKGSD